MALRNGYAALSPKLKLSQHPKNAVNWRPGTKGFYKPKYSASKMKWNFELPYKREVDSLFHYPEVSRTTGKLIDWYHGKPEDGFEAVRIFGDHTLELKGMPKGRTPEYMQERLRRFFAKFGPVAQCRAEPHRLDPYQCEGTAYVTFRDSNAALKALRAPLKFPASLHDKIVSMRHLESGKQNDTDYYEKAKFWDNELISIARQLHSQLCGSEELRTQGKPLASVSRGLLERELVLKNDSPPDPDAPVPRLRGGVPLPKKGLHQYTTRLVTARDAVRLRFGTWGHFLAEAPFDELFRLSRPPASAEAAAAAEATADSDASANNAEAAAAAGAGDVVVLPRLLSAVQRTRVLARARNALRRRLLEEFSVYWREGKITLPEYTRRRVEWWDHTPPLPFELQIQSRPRDIYKIFDERFVYRQQLVRARNERRKENRAKWTEERKEMLEEKQKAKEARRAKAFAAVGSEGCSALLGRGLAPPRA
eukprot:TRINITY_DN16845_c0_g1_i1.p2 TRINITY_DN16845_c0_g1~~TRINITY_DN16845_c0_g1_i1.p2  ORF type:complete len:479 (-),score=133.22 TRINITY_DN16845_c0_g1_i1:9-1445(-)